MQNYSSEKIKTLFIFLYVVDYEIGVRRKLPVICGLSQSYFKVLGWIVCIKTMGRNKTGWPKDCF